MTRYQCPVCGRQRRTAKAVQDHMAKVHPDCERKPLIATDPRQIDWVNDQATTAWEQHDLTPVSRSSYG